MNKEIRNYQGELVVENRNVSGYAIVFDSESVDMGFIETISRSAITQEQIDNSDIFAFYNHNDEEVLARSVNGVGSLKLTVDEVGVRYEFEAPNTQRGDELLEHIKRGELFGSSFGFSLPIDGSGERWEKLDGKYHRTITKIERLYEISPVFQPAYPSTECNNRSKDKVNEFDKLHADLDVLMTEIEELAKC